jgi:hypothetical protein
MNAWCSLWLFAFALAESGRRFLCVDLLCAVVAVLCAVLCAVEWLVFDDVLDVCFLCVDEDDELLCDQHETDTAPARTKAANLFPITANLLLPCFNLCRKWTE